MSTARKVLENTLVQVGGKIGMAAASIITVKLITNYLGTGGYGEYSQVYEFLALFGVFADLGLFTIAVREMSKDESKVPYIIGNILSLRSMAAFLAMLLAVFVVFLIPRYKGTYVPIGVAISSVTVFLSILNGTVSSVLQVHLKMTMATLALIASKIVSLAYIFWAITRFSDNPEMGFIHLMFAGVAGNLVMFFLTWTFAKKLTHIKPRFDWVFWKDVFFKSLPYGLALVLNMVYFRINSVLLFNLRGAEEAGIFAVPLKIIEILGVIAIFFMNSVLPSLTRNMKLMNKKEHKHKANSIIQYCFDFLTACGLPLVIGSIILAYPIIFVIASPEFLSRLDEGFYGSDIAFQILIVALFFSFLSTLFTFVLIALNKQNKLLGISALGAVFSVILNLLTIPKYGFIGAGLTSIFSEIFIFVSLFYLTHKYFDYKIRLNGAFKSFFSALIMGLVLIAVRDPLYSFLQAKSIMILIPLGGVVYTASMIATRGITREMIDVVKK